MAWVSVPADGHQCAPGAERTGRRVMLESDDASGQFNGNPHLRNIQASERPVCLQMYTHTGYDKHTCVIYDVALGEKNPNNTRPLKMKEEEVLMCLT